MQVKSFDYNVSHVNTNENYYTSCNTNKERGYFFSLLKTVKLTIYKWTHWEYYPFQLVYLPMYLVWLYYAIKARSLFFFAASNPLIKNGGFLMESKKSIYDLMPTTVYPNTLFVKTENTVDVVLQKMNSVNLNFPVIAKPDVGMRGMAVKKINSIAELQHYISTITVDYLIQEFIDLPQEAGIFYVRIPGEIKGKITGIVAKEFMTVTGDGKSSVLDLVERNPRYLLQLDALTKIYGSRLSEIIPKGQTVNLIPYGNHCRGTKFIDATGWASEKLNDAINNVCLQIPQFYYGRLDLKFNSIEELEEGKNFSIIELNAAGSEPTHIYDPTHSIFFAWKEIAKHFRLLYKVSVINKRNGASYLNFKEGMQMLKENKELTKKLKSVAL